MSERFVVVSHAKARSQKASGLTAIRALALPLPPYALIQEAKTVNHSASSKDLEQLNNMGSDIFFRPCPTKPRHGFVNSRVIPQSDRLTGLHKLADEILAAGEPVEIIAMPRIDALASAVWTQDSLTIGPGHDGATAGRNCQILTMPMPPKWISYLRSILKPAFDEDVFLEVVWGKPQDIDEYTQAIQPWVVQARIGPKVPKGAGNYVPKETTIKLVMNPNSYTWQQWERMCPKFKEGTVVHIPNGSRTCHPAIHAIINKVPIVFDLQKPKVGTVLEPTKAVEKPKLCYEQARRGFFDGLQEPISVCYGLAAAHSYGAIDFTSPIQASAWGRGIGRLVKAAIAVVGGEARYAKHREVVIFGPNRPSWLKTHQGQVRDDVYSEVAEWGTDLLSRHAHYWWFCHSLKKSTGGYSGPRWTKAASLALRIGNYFTLPKSKLEANWSRLASCTNSLAVAVHNGGALFNKFHDTDYLNRIAKTPGLFIGPFIIEEHPAYPTHSHVKIWKAGITASRSASKKIKSVINKPQKLTNFKIRHYSEHPKSHMFRVQSIVPNMSIEMDFHIPGLEPQVFAAYPKSSSNAGTDKVYHVCSLDSYIKYKPENNIVINFKI